MCRLLFAKVLIVLGLTSMTVSKEAPCDFKDTVDLTGAKEFPNNGSYLFEGLIIPKNLTGTYEFRTHISSIRVPSELHVRGCVCQLKPCLSFCCPLHQYFNESQCVDVNTPIEFNALVNITSKNGSLVTTNVFNQFAIQYGRPCEVMYKLAPHLQDYDKYALFENGTLLRLDDMAYVEKEDYCFSQMSTGWGETLLVPVNCFLDPESNFQSKLNGVGLLISVPFMVLTVFVYLLIPELRTLQGLSFCCYLMSLSIGYLFMAFLIFLPMQNFSNFECSFLGHTAYYAFMAAFLWLSVISFDLHSTFKGSRPNDEIKTFKMYSLYAWGLALVLLILTFTAQNTNYVPEEWKSLIGSLEYCWFNTKTGWSAFVYFYGPILIVIIYNTVMFVLISLQIKQQKSFITSNDQRHHFQRDLFLTYLRLFILMGITWFAEIFSYLVSKDSWLKNIFIITDLLNGLQGFIIFCLFVLRKPVRQKLHRRDDTVQYLFL